MVSERKKSTLPIPIRNRHVCGLSFENRRAITSYTEISYVSERGINRMVRFKTSRFLCPDVIKNKKKVFNRCRHTESGRPTEFDQTDLLQTVQPVRASLSAEDGQRFREKIGADQVCNYKTLATISKRTCRTKTDPIAKQTLNTEHGFELIYYAAVYNIYVIIHDFVVKSRKKK